MEITPPSEKWELWFLDKPISITKWVIGRIFSFRFTFSLLLLNLIFPSFDSSIIEHFTDDSLDGSINKLIKNRSEIYFANKDMLDTIIKTIEPIQMRFHYHNSSITTCDDACRFMLDIGNSTNQYQWKSIERTSLGVDCEKSEPGIDISLLEKLRKKTGDIVRSISHLHGHTMIELKPWLIMRDETPQNIRIFLVHSQRDNFSTMNRLRYNCCMPAFAHGRMEYYNIQDNWRMVLQIMNQGEDP